WTEVKIALPSLVRQSKGVLVKQSKTQLEKLHEMEYALSGQLHKEWKLQVAFEELHCPVPKCEKERQAVISLSAGAIRVPGKRGNAEEATPPHEKRPKASVASSPIIAPKVVADESSSVEAQSDFMFSLQ